MVLSGKKNKKTIAELEEFYAGRNGTKAGMAWVMAFLSLLITIVVIGGIFYGGRWAYRSITDTGDDSDLISSVQSTDIELPPGTVDESGVIVGSSTDTVAVGGSTTDVNTEVPTNDVEEAGAVSEEAASTDIPSTDRQAIAGISTTDSNSIAAAGDASELPNTGAGNFMALVLSGVVAFGYFVARKFQLS